MKTQIKLELYNNGPFTDYQIKKYTGFVCGDFVRYFLNCQFLPKAILFTYSIKNPKEKGFKKITVLENNDDWLPPFKVYVSGKFYKDVNLFWQAKTKFDESGRNDFWVKIEVIE